MLNDSPSVLKKVLPSSLQCDIVTENVFMQYHKKISQRISSWEVEQHSSEKDVEELGSVLKKSVYKSFLYKPTIFLKIEWPTAMGF